jgi:adenylate cyclase
MVKVRNERRLSAILAADIVGYSRLMGVDEAGTLDALLRLRAELFEPEVAVGRGKIIKSMGDGWLVSFPSVAEAVACAFQIQDKLANHEIVKLRIGVHTGDVVFRDDDIFGDGVNVAARLQEFSEPGAVALSDAAFGSLDGALAPSFDDVGWQDFKNIARPIQVWQRAAPLPPAAGSNANDGLDERPALILRPVTTSDERAEIGDLANALTGDIAGCFASVGWLNATTSNDAGTDETAYQMSAVLRARGSRLRLEVSLSAPDEQVIWSGKYDGHLDDAFDWQDETARQAAVDSIGQVLDRELQRLRSLDLADMTAEECVVASVMEFALLDEASMLRNLDYLAAAIEKRPDYAEGYGFAICNYIACMSMNLVSVIDRYQAAFPKWAAAGSQLDNPTPVLTISLGLAAYRLEGDAPSLRRAIKDVLRRAPFSVEVVCYCGFGYTWMGDPEPALDCFRSGEKLMTFNPFAMPMLGGASIASVMAGNDDAAIAYAKKGLETSDGYMALHTSLIAAYGHKGEIAAAQHHIARLEELRPGYSVTSRRASSGYADTPGNRRFEEGMRKAGMPE